MRSFNDLFNLNQKVVLVIGGAGYLGSAICETMAELSASVIITSRDGLKCVKYAEELSNRYGIQARGYAVDIMNIESIERLLENIKNDEDIEREFVYEMPFALKQKFKKSSVLHFDVKAVYKDIFAQGLKSKEVLDRSISQHAQICFENSEDVFDARMLAKLLKEEIAYRIRLYSYCIMNNTKNYKEWLEEDYERKLRLKLSQMFAKKM